MMNWNDLAKEIRRVNEANGFDKPTWDNFPVKLMLIVTEIDEAVQGKDTNIAEELADIMIRGLDIFESCHLTYFKGPCQIVPTRARSRVWESCERTMWPVVHDVVNAVEAWRHGERSDAFSYLQAALRTVESLSEDFGIDLHAEVEKKVKKNATRGHLHGKVRADG